MGILGGVVSPRQFTSVVQTWELPNGGRELASQGIKHRDFPPKKGFVEGWNQLYGHLVTRIAEKDAPKVSCDGETMAWSRCRYMMQNDIKGWIPKRVVNQVMCGGQMDTFNLCREYMLTKKYGFKVTVKVLSEK